MAVTKTRYHSYKIKDLAQGCKYCVNGEKSVFFITGLCGSQCFYCPISDKKKGKDTVYINEWPTVERENILKEIRLCKSKGVGITGGDPLISIQRTTEWIKILKKKFGKKFHIHLYTPLDLVNEEKLKMLYEAGLDEIRFHPNMDDNSTWNRLELAFEHDWDIGVEIPAIPRYERIIQGMIDHIGELNSRSKKNKVTFMNLNELEIADNSFNQLSEMGYKTKDRLSYAIDGSEKLALDMMKHIEKQKMPLKVHFCTAKLKDKVQMTKRIAKRAKSIARPYDKITNQGTLKRGVIYLRELRPEFGYRERLKRYQRNNALKEETLKKLEKAHNKITKFYKISKSKIDVDEEKLRLLIDKSRMDKIKDELKRDRLFPAVVEEYPTHDGFEVEVEFL